MKTLICCVLGIADVPLEDIGGVTPLQKAYTPTLDSLAQEGGGRVVALPCHEKERLLLSLLGGNAAPPPLSRGVLEAYSLGYVLTPHQEAFSIRFVSSGEDTIVDVSEDLISDEEGKELCRDLTMELGERGYFFSHVQGPHALIIRDKSIDTTTHMTYCTNPIHCIGKRWYDVFPYKDKHYAELFDALQKAVEVLTYHEINILKHDFNEEPANSILLCDKGKKTTSFPQKKSRNLSSALLYTSSAASVGTAALLDMDVAIWPTEKKKYENILACVEGLEDVFKGKDTVIMEVEHVWKSTYMGNLLEKIKTIEWLDKFVMKPCVQYCKENDVRFVMLPLSRVDIRSGDVASGSIPAIICDGQKGEGVEFFDEKALEEAPLLSLAAVL